MKLAQVTCVLMLIYASASSVFAQKQYKSPEEYNLYTSITKDFAANDMAKVLAGLEDWKTKFPGSDFAGIRQQLFVQAQVRSGQPAKAIQAAKDVIAGPFDSADDQFRLLYTVATAVQQIPSPDAEARAIAADAARQLRTFDKMPSGMKPEDWEKTRAGLQATAAGALIHIALTPVREAIQGGDCASAESAGSKTVQEFPQSVQAAWVLGSAQLCLARKQPEKYSPALYLLARAAVLDSVAGLADPAWQKATAEPYLEKAYTKYHGTDPEGLSQLKKQALGAPLPPEGFVILSARQIEQQKQADFESKNPELALWVRIKSALVAENGESYFQSELKNAAVPALTGTLLAAKPACRPTELSVAVSRPDATGARPAEISLHLSRPLGGKPDGGSDFRFEGIPSGFTREPFQLTMESDPLRIKGLKVAPCGGAVRKR